MAYYSAFSRRDFCLCSKNCLKNADCGTLFLSVVSRLRAIIAVLLVALWLPATSWCLLERAGWVTCNDDGRPVGESQESSACCVIASSTYKLDGSQRTAVPLLVDAPVLLVGLFESQSIQSGCVEFGVSPPEIFASWQFSSRAASAPRAPSIAS